MLYVVTTTYNIHKRKAKSTIYRLALVNKEEGLWQERVSLGMTAALRLLLRGLKACFGPFWSWRDRSNDPQPHHAQPQGGLVVSQGRPSTANESSCDRASLEIVSWAATADSVAAAELVQALPARGVAVRRGWGLRFR